MPLGRSEIRSALIFLCLMMMVDSPENPWLKTTQIYNLEVITIGSNRSRKVRSIATCEEGRKGEAVIGSSETSTIA